MEWQRSPCFGWWILGFGAWNDRYCGVIRFYLFGSSWFFSYGKVYKDLKRKVLLKLGFFRSGFEGTESLMPHLHYGQWLWKLGCFD